MEFNVKQLLTFMIVSETNIKGEAKDTFQKQEKVVYQLSFLQPIETWPSYDTI